MNKSNILSLEPYLNLDSKPYVSDSFMKDEKVVLAVSTDIEYEDLNPFSIEAFDKSAKLMRALYENGNRFTVVHGIRDQYNFLSKKELNLNPLDLIKRTQELVGLFLNTSFSDPTKLPLDLPVVIPTHVEVDNINYRFDYNDYSYQSITSPDILSILEINEIKTMINHGIISICGGIPVVKKVDQVFFNPYVLDSYDYVDEEILIDKDLVASEIAKAINAKLLIVTNVPGVFDNFGSRDEVLIPEMTLDDAYSYLENHFDDSAMWPKIQSAASHAEDGGMTVITDFDNAMKILETGRVDGTQATVVAPVKGPNAA